MHLKAEAYQYPPAGFELGQWVRFEGKRYRVLASTHTHTQLEGLEKAIANWYLKKCH